MSFRTPGDRKQNKAYLLQRSPRVLEFFVAAIHFDVVHPPGCKQMGLGEFEVDSDTSVSSRRSRHPRRSGPSGLLFQRRSWSRCRYRSRKGDHDHGCIFLKRPCPMGTAWGPPLADPSRRARGVPSSHRCSPACSQLLAIHPARSTEPFHDGGRNPVPNYSWPVTVTIIAHARLQACLISTGTSLPRSIITLQPSREIERCACSTLSLQHVEGEDCCQRTLPACAGLRIKSLHRLNPKVGTRSNRLSFTRVLPAFSAKRYG